jgi:hypothetical protein
LADKKPLPTSPQGRRKEEKPHPGPLQKRGRKGKGNVEREAPPDLPAGEERERGNLKC